MASVVERVIGALLRRRAMALALFAAICGLGVWAATGLGIGQDVSDLLPSLSREDSRALDFIARSSLFDRLYVDLSGAEPEALAGYASRLADRLEKEADIGAVESRLRPEEEMATAALVFEHRFHLLRAADPRLDRILERPGIVRALALDKASLLGPMAGMSGAVAKDPLGLADLVRDDLAGMAASERIRMYRGLAFSPDLGHCLLRIRTDVRALRVDDAGDLVDRVRRAAREEKRTAAEKGIVAGITGAHVFASESARAVKSDVNLSFVLASLGIMTLLGACFRRPIPVLSALLPSAVSVLAGFAIAAILLGRISGIAVGFGSIVVGISVDYSIHYLQERLAAGSAEGAEAGAIRRVLPSMTAGFLTTLAVFMVYGMSSFPLIRELGLFAGVGVTAGFLSAVLVVPIVPVRLRAGGTPRVFSVVLPDSLIHPSRRRAWVTVLASVAILACAGVAIPRLEMDDDVRRLDYRSAATARTARDMERRWLGQQEGRVVVARGTTTEEALRRNDVVASILARAGVPMASIAGVLPSEETQRSNLASLLERDWTGLRAILESEADALGFAPGTFDPFFEDLGRAGGGDPPPVVERDLDGTPMAHLAAGSIVRVKGEVAVLTFLPGGHMNNRASALLAHLRPDVVVTSRVEVMNRVFESVRSEVLRLSALGLLVVLLVLLLRYRCIGTAVVSLVPVAVACVLTAGVLATSGIEMNAIAVLAFTLILGLGIDYGIFVVDAIDHGGHAGLTGGAVLFSGLTTMASFGTLALCRSPVLRSIGVVVLAGILASNVAALFLVPALKALIANGGRRG